MSLATKVARTLFGAYEGTRDVEARAAPRGTVAWHGSIDRLGGLFLPLGLDSRRSTPPVP